MFKKTFKKKKKKRKKRPLSKRLHDKAWGIFSKYIRLRDKRCITCTSMQDLQAGHYYHVDCLDFDEINVNAQCKRCNYFKSGNLTEYAIYLKDKYGSEILDELKRKSAQVKRWRSEELQEIIEKYTKKIKELKDDNQGY